MSKQGIYTVGGTVQAGSGVYIPREADQQLLALCLAGDFAFVLTPRQMGKSSLVVSTAQRLAEEKVRSVIIDLSGMGVKLSQDAWYLGLLDQIKDALDLKTDVIQWWRAHDHWGVTQRLTEFLGKVALSEVQDRVVIFVDEIDTTLSLDFTDDFFAAIRYFHNARANSRDMRRLSFVLIGVATPGDLIRDPQRTPFNIGNRVDLNDFTFEEALPFACGLGLPDNEARQVLGWIMKWTHGHPYLTQKLCQTLREQAQNSWTEADVDTTVADTFLHTVKEPDENLKTVRDMLTKRAPDREGVLNTYRQIRIAKSPVPDEEQSLVKNHLKLSGVVRRERFVAVSRKWFSRNPVKDAPERIALRLRNPIYGEVFNEAWVKEHMPVNWFARAKRSGIVIAVILVLVSIGFSAFRLQSAMKEQNRLKAENARFQVEREEFMSQNLSQKANQIDPYAGYQMVGETQYAKEGQSPPEERSLKLNQLQSGTIYAETKTGSLKYALYDDFSIVFTRTTPEGGSINTWLPKPPKKIDDAPGKLPGTQSQLEDEYSPGEAGSGATFIRASFTRGESKAAVTVGNCVDPHPGTFRSWYGEKNGCWVAVYREWPDGCQHYQWYNACYNYWDTYPNGAPKVYWTRCVH